MPRVIQWATGVTGMISLRHVIERADLELVGVRVYDPAKAGVDAGTLCGCREVGLHTTADRDEIINTDADVVLYMGKVETDTPGCFADVCELLASGKNVVATGSRFIHPRSLHASLADDIENACRTGQSSFLGVGLYPGFFGESLAPVLSRLTARTRRISVREVLNYSTYASHDLIFNAMGFGHTTDDTTPLLTNTDYAASAWIGSATVLAQSLGLKIRSVQGFREVQTTPRALTVAAGEIPAGTVAAMRFGVEIDCGATTVAVEHLTRMADDLAPDWPTEIGYELSFDGEPNLKCHLVIGSHDQDHAKQGCLATAMHAINAIPTVMAADPGLYDVSTITPFVAHWTNR
ncbi:dihydrodipicolinate reductase [Mycobacterium sp. 852002-53434_SCH5985345]|uniref:NAD(P)H-dependent amine dehydrogenase family protein n=1 Tax=unclassified Mycobacterium TaxID=2642494 RepID=UPI0007FE10BE|nr:MULTISPECIES: dihydrodipicolinate reductase [unclassified Mycobacterium]OBF49087.1 dihydrodipicolinate reductase [Mycobacterium sp. 852002-53434_SCH5985345]OBF96584.1 dihydrodipicolinate reductase [Mycobacterium sp. 852014-52450_SCH5900713]